MFALTAKTLFGMEGILADELAALGAQQIKRGRRLVDFRGDQRMLYSANIWLRTAIRILKPIHQFVAADEQGLYDGVRQVEWSQYLTATGSLTIDPVVFSSFTTHSLYAAQLAKDAIVDQFREQTGTRPSVNRDDPDLRINLHINQNRATLYLDSSGDSLHKRGYRAHAGEAPLNEVLAAGLLKLAGWKGTGALVDFMCGSGTLPIEAALLARNIAPGTIRKSFAYMRWKDFDAALHAELLDQAREAYRDDVQFTAVGSDLDEQMIAVAKQNARQAGVDGDIHFEVAHFESAAPPTPQGLLIANPPYDERLKMARSALVYERIGRCLQEHWSNWRTALFTGNLEAAEHLGLKTARKVTLYNGPIECRLFLTHPNKNKTPKRVMNAPGEFPRSETLLAAAASPVDLSPTVDTQAADLPQSIKALADVSSPLSPQPTRLAAVAVAAPPIMAIRTAEPASSDQATGMGTLVEPTTRLDQAPAREPSVETARETADREDRSFDPELEAAEAVATSPGVRTWEQQAEAFANRLTRMNKHWARWARRQGITCFRLYDRDVPEVPLAIDWYEGWLHVAEYDRPHDRTELEHGRWLEYMVDAAAEVLGVARSQISLKRRLRQRGLSQYDRQADAGQVLHVSEGGHAFEVNLFDYLDTGLFLDHRITRGMVQKESKGKRVLNLFAYTGAFSVYAAGGGAASTTTVDLSNTYLDWGRTNMSLNGFEQPWQQFIRDDALSFLNYLPNRHWPPFDLAIVDPPTFSNSKRFADVWDVQRDHVQLLNGLIPFMSEGGKIFFSTNFRRFKLQAELLQGVTIREISRQTVPPDFRNRRIHRCWTMIKQPRLDQ